MNRKYVAYAIIAILLALSIGVLAISLGVHFSSAPVAAQEVPTEPPPSPPSTPDSLAPPSPPPVRTEVICAGFRLDSWCDRSGYFWDGEIDGDDPYLHYIPCAAGHKHWSCNPIFRRRHANCRAPAPRQTTTQTVRQTSSSRAQSPSQSPSQNPPASPPQSSCTKPKVHFKTWTVGGPKGRVKAKDTSFITNSETTCKVYAEVTYDSGQDASTTCEITSASWTVTMSHGFTVKASTVDTDSTGSGLSEVWTYEATLTGPEMKTPKNWDCNERWETKGPRNSDKKEYAGRNQQRMHMEIEFSGSYSGGTVKVSQTLTQIPRDGIRQEYVDYNLNIIPDRGDFRSNSNIRYNWGHYPDWAIDYDLPGRHKEWAKWVDPSFTTADLELSSGYRHPYHNFYCVGATAKHGLHHYGLALDVSADLDNSGAATNAEKLRVEDGARKAGVDSRHIFRYGNTKHIHADWRPTDWATRRVTANSTIGTPKSVVPAPAPTPPSNNGGSGGGGSDDGGDSGGGGDSAPAAPAAPTTPATPKTTPTTPTTVRCGNRWRGNSACSSGGRASSRTAHESTCGAGHTYWSCNRNAVAWHATTYTCTRSGCSDTFTRCAMDTGSARSCRSNGRNYRWHNR